MRGQTNFLLAAIGGLLMSAALASSFITVATQQYRGVLTIASAAVMLSIFCFAILFIRGRLGWRIIAIVLSLPALLVLSELIRRAPAVFG